MKNNIRLLVTVVGASAFAVAAQAITISGVSGTLEDGSPLVFNVGTGSSEGYDFIPGPGAGPGASGIEIHTVNNTLLGGPQGPQAVSFNYTVTADPGMRIVGYQVTPGMFLYEADGQINLNHSGYVDNNHFSDALDPIGDAPGTTVGLWSKAITPSTSLNVAGSYAISTKNDLFAEADALHLNITYTEQPVPEPSAMIALAIGGIGLIRRRRSK